MTDVLIPQTDSFLYQLIEKLAPDQAKVGDWVQEIRSQNPDLGNDAIAKHISSHVIKIYSKQGAALALPGAVPGLGTITQIAAEMGMITADLSLLVRNQTYLVFALSHCFGERGRELLIQDTLICMGLWSNALTLTKSGAIQLGTKVVEANFKKHFPAKILQAINKKVGVTIVTKYGTKRGGIAIGKLIPYGVGMFVGAIFNYLVMKKFASSTTAYFNLELPLPKH